MKFGKYIVGALSVIISCSCCSKINEEQYFLLNEQVITEKEVTVCTTTVQVTDIPVTTSQTFSEESTTTIATTTTTQTSTDMTLTSPTIEVSTITGDFIPYETEWVTEPFNDPTDDTAETQDKDYTTREDIQYLYDVSEYERQLMIHTVFQEAGSESFECKKAVASVILNRSILYNMTVSEVIFEPNQFSIDFSYLSYDTESESAVDEVLAYGTNIPDDVLFFYADYCWDDFLRGREIYTQFDNTIFAY